MNVKSVFLFASIIASNSIGFSVNAQPDTLTFTIKLSDSDKQALEELEIAVKNEHRDAPSLGGVLLALSSVRAENTKEYKELEAFDKAVQYHEIRNKMWDQRKLCENDSSSFAFFNEDCRLARKLEREFQGLTKQRDVLCAKAKSTLEYKAKGRGLLIVASEIEQIN